MVQVAIGQMDILAGKRHYWPIYEAAAKYNLPVGFHVGAESAGNNSSQLAVGAPTHYIELQTGLISIGIQNTISLVCEGVFSKFPTLKVGLFEYGWTWLPGLMWRLDREWLSFRTEIPWVTKPPSEYIKEHIRVGTQPLEAPSQAHLHQNLRNDVGRKDDALRHTITPTGILTTPTTSCANYPNICAKRSLTKTHANSTDSNHVNHPIKT